ncbi:MAG: F0F1 ATP synthase subunit A [Candidatus Omnitrophica bacterium]|nr:F0F1 ATP synthase subunit A [Candidatus Omnitrophota bacterium]
MIEHGYEAVAHEAGLPELPNLVTVMNSLWPHQPVSQFLHRWENVVFAWALAAGLVAVFAWSTRRLTLVPGRLQTALETIVEALEGLVTSILGHEGRRYTPFIGTLFLYIVTMNLAGLVPGLKSPTSSLNTTVGLAVCVFLYVQWTGIRRQGVAAYVKHFLGEPLFLAPLNVVLHVLGECIKPLSLSLRLFANITGEDLTIYYLIGLGLMCVGGTLLAGPPFQTLFYPLAIMFSLIQALVFSLLSTVYISLMLPHEHGQH